jgi:hypothetical protein
MLISPFGGEVNANAQKLKSAVVLTLSKFTLNINDRLNIISILLKDEKMKKIKKFR